MTLLVPVTEYLTEQPKGEKVYLGVQCCRAVPPGAEVTAEQRSCQLGGREAEKSTRKKGRRQDMASEGCSQRPTSFHFSPAPNNAVKD